MAMHNGKNGLGAHSSLTFEDGQPRSTRAMDSPEFVERVQAAARQQYGGSLEEIASDPALREVMYSAIADGLRSPPKQIPEAMMRVVERMAAVGITVTPGTCDLRDMPPPRKLGFSLTDALLEERYGHNGLERA